MQCKKCGRISRKEKLHGHVHGACSFCSSGASTISNNLMKVLHVTPSYFPAFVYGGPIRSTHQMNLGLATRGIMVRVLTTDAKGKDRLAESGKSVRYGERLEVEYAPRMFMPDISLRFLWKLPAAVRWADIVHITAVYSFSTIPAL